MPLRLANFSDHNAIASLCSAAFFNEDLFGRVMHPRRNEYPDDPALFWHAFVREHWFDWRNTTLVAVTNDGEDGKDKEEKIVGAAIWVRQGDGGNKLALSRWDPRSILPYIIKLSNALNSYVYPNRALDPSQSDILPRSWPFCQHHWAGFRADNWYLSLCAVDPAYQGKGFGKELVQWGIKEAEREHVHASVMCSDGKEQFYLRSGFEQIVGNATEGEGNPLRDVKGGAILFKFPKSNEAV